MKFDVRNKTPLAEGGEGIIYEIGNNKVAKIYKSHIDLKSKENRAKLLISATLPKEVIRLTETVTDYKGRFIGIVMPKVSGEDFKKLSNKKFVVANNINTKDILEMLSKIWNTLKILHSQNIFIGDLNDQNILFDPKTKDIFIIDTDSWTIGTERCQVAMDLFRDPKLVKDNFNADTDTYAFCVLAWKSLTRIHPFGGTMNPDMQIIERISKGISVIDNGSVKLPRTTKSWKNLSPDLVGAFKKVFNDGERKFGDYISQMLNNLVFCKRDGDYYFGEYSSCPFCNSAAIVVKKATSIGVEDGFKIAPMLDKDSDKMIFSDTIYLNQNNEVVDVLSGRKIQYNGGRCLL